MKKAVIVLLEIAILFIVLRSSFAQYLLNDMQQTVSGWFVSLSQVEEKQQLGSLNKTLAPHTRNLNKYQQEYLADITSDKFKLQKFYRLYCVEKDKNPYIYGPTLLFVCNEAAKVPGLESHPP